MSRLFKLEKILTRIHADSECQNASIFYIESGKTVSRTKLKKCESFELKSSQLNKKLDQLTQLAINPENYLRNHIEKLIDEVNSSLAGKHLCDELINEINLFDKQLPNNFAFDSKILIQIKQQIENMDTFNDDFEEFISQLTIQYHKKLFNNKSIFLLKRTTCEDLSLFKKGINFKLVTLNNEYLTNESIQLLTKKYLFIIMN